MGDEKQVIAVTPPGMDTERVRDWIASTARGNGWSALEWRDESDSNGLPVGRLYGFRGPAEDGEDEQ